jgi:hypothetical protein
MLFQPFRLKNDRWPGLSLKLIGGIQFGKALVLFKF